MGLKILKKQIKLKKNSEKYFIKKYFQPDLKLRLANKLLHFANTSIDVSDGLISDLEKLVNKQKLTYKLNLVNIPISSNLKNLLLTKRLNKISYISQGDDYQILFTASNLKSRIISNISKSLGIKISKRGKICSINHKSQIIDQKGNKITLKNKDYNHNF